MFTFIISDYDNMLELTDNMANGIDASDDGGWIEWRRLILHELQRLNTIQERSGKTIVLLQKDIARLNVWATICGALGGITATLILQAMIG